MTGRFSPGFERYGGGTQGIRVLLDGLNASRGTAYDTSDNGVVYAENEAIARVLWNAWEQSRRFANQFDPARMTDLLPRWEKIFGLTPLDTDSVVARRAAVAERWARIGVVPTRTEIVDRLRAVLGDIYVAYETIAAEDAVMWWPGGTPNPLAPWYSTTARVLVQVRRPAGMTLGEFWGRLGSINPIFDQLGPTWITWDWYLEGSTGGFVLDDELNLDHERFDIDI